MAIFISVLEWDCAAVAATRRRSFCWSCSYTLRLSFCYSCSYTPRLSLLLELQLHSMTVSYWSCNYILWLSYWFCGLGLGKRENEKWAAWWTGPG